MTYVIVSIVTLSEDPSKVVVSDLSRVISTNLPIPTAQEVAETFSLKDPNHVLEERTLSGANIYCDSNRYTDIEKVAQTIGQMLEQKRAAVQPQFATAAQADAVLERANAWTAQADIG